MEAPQSLDVPASKFKKKHGISFDFGSSQIKIAYATCIGDRVKLNFASFANERFDEALQFIADVYGDKFEPGEVVTATGVNCDQDKLQEKFNIRINIVIESGMLIGAFHFLVKNFSLPEITFPLPKTVEEKAERGRDAYAHNKRILADLSLGRLKQQSVFSKEHINPSSDEPSHVELPLLYFHIGSAFTGYKIERDGSNICIDGSSICGRSLLALGSLITGTNTFEELIDLASKSSNSVDIDIGDALKSVKKGLYTNMCEGYLVFNLGKTVGKPVGDFSREDLAAGCVSMLTTSLADRMQMTAAAHGAKQVFFGGGLSATSQYDREELWTKFKFRSLINPLEIPTQAYFFKHGVFLPSLGTLLYSMQVV